MTMCIYHDDEDMIRGLFDTRKISWWPATCTAVTRITGLKVLLVTAEKEISDSISVSLQLRWPQTGVMSCLEGAMGVKLAKTQSPDVVVIDLDLPTMDALDVLEEVRQASGALVMALSRPDDEWRRVRALGLGADDCITKPFNVVEFLARLTALLRRTVISELQGGRLPSFAGNDLVINFATREVTVSGEPLKLTCAECRVLPDFARNGGRVFSTVLD